MARYIVRKVYKDVMAILVDAGNEEEARKLADAERFSDWSSEVVHEYPEYVIEEVEDAAI